MSNTISHAVEALSLSSDPTPSPWPEIFALSGNQKKDIDRQLANLKNQWRQSPDTKSLQSLAAMSRRNYSGASPCRLLLALPIEQDPVDLCDAAIEFLADKTEARWAEKNCCYGQGTFPGKIAFVFPGQGSQYTGMGKHLIGNFPEIADALILGDRSFDRLPRLTEYIYPAPAAREVQTSLKENSSESSANTEERLRSTDVAQPAIGAISMGMLRVFEKFSIRPDACCGHSFGELTALFAANRLDAETFMSLAVARGKYMATAGEGKDRGAMLAVGAPISDIESLVALTGLDLVLANRNGPDQGVISGPTEAVHQMKGICKERKIRATLLPVAAAFHSRLVKDAAEPFQKMLAAVKLGEGDIPVYANTTGRIYPADPDEARRLLGAQLLHPVNFMDEIKNMYDDGIRIFIEIGPKNVLTGLINAILKQQDGAFAFAVDASAGRRSGLVDLAVALCRIASMGYPVDLNKWMPFAPA